MKLIKHGGYITDNSDLLIFINKIFYENNEYIKAKITLTNKRNHLFYETKTFKIFKNKITHWKRAN